MSTRIYDRRKRAQGQQANLIAQKDHEINIAIEAIAILRIEQVTPGM